MQIDAIGRRLLVPGIHPSAPNAADNWADKMPTLITAVEAANRAELFGEDRELSFSRDTESRKPVIQIKDRKTGEVIQQIPAQDLLDMLKNLQQSASLRQNR